MTDLSSNVSQGALFLDEQFPGWHDRINTETLLMSSCALCVLGQLYGAYGRAVYNHRLTRTDRWRLGFSLPADPDGSGFRMLGILWKREIAARKLAATRERELELVEV